MAVYAYNRVSTNKQDFMRQESEIEDYCLENNIKVDRYFFDKITGKRFDRKEYLEMKELVVPGDTIIIEEIERFGRNWDEMKDEWKFFEKKDVIVIVIRTPILNMSIYNDDGTVDLTKKLMRSIAFEMYCYGAEDERIKISTRTKEKLKALKKQGVKLGRPVEEKRSQIAEMLREGEKNVSEIAFLLETSRAQVYRVKKELGL